MYSIAENAQFAQVQALWQHGFPADSPEEIAAFWTMAQNVGGHCLLRWENEQAVSMAFLLPATGRVGVCEWPLSYVYAAVTHPDYRGRGLFGDLLDEAAARAAQNGVAALFLRPAEPSLFGYYQKHGFEKPMLAAETMRQANDLDSAFESDDLHNAGEGYVERRKEWLFTLNSPHVEWPDEWLRYAVNMAEESGGGAVFAPYGTAFCERDGACLLVRELLCAPNDRERLLTALARRFPCQELHVNTPPFNEKNATVFGLLRPCTGDFPTEPLYMGLAME